LQEIGLDAGKHAGQYTELLTIFEGVLRLPASSFDSGGAGVSPAMRSEDLA
jgi:hypothetical protein